MYCVKNSQHKFCVLCTYKIAQCNDLLPLCVHCNYIFEKFRNICHIDIAKCLMTNKESDIFKHLPYNLKELRDHFESKFEPWMNWSNRGHYRLDKWKDDDQSTWKWQIDHIIPQHLFLFNDYDFWSFKDCWNINNLRPVSAKYNCSRRKEYYLYYNKIKPIYNDILSRL